MQEAHGDEADSYPLLQGLKLSPRAARVAAIIEGNHGERAELVEGNRGEFTVWVGEERVAGKDAMGFPTEPDVLAAVGKAFGPWLIGRAVHSPFDFSRSSFSLRKVRISSAMSSNFVHCSL